MDLWMEEEHLRQKACTHKAKCFSSPLSPSFFGSMFCEGRAAISRDQKEWMERSVMCSGYGPIWELPILEDSAVSDHHLLNQPKSAAWLPSMHSGSVGAGVGCIARDVSWSVGRFVYYKIIQLRQRKELAKIRAVCIFKSEQSHEVPFGEAESPWKPCSRRTKIVVWYGKPKPSQ